MQVGWLVRYFLCRQGTEMLYDSLTNLAQIAKRTKSIYRISWSSIFCHLFSWRTRVLSVPCQPWRLCFYMISIKDGLTLLIDLVKQPLKVNLNTLINMHHGGSCGSCSASLPLLLSFNFFSIIILWWWSASLNWLVQLILPFNDMLYFLV